MDHPKELVCDLDGHHRSICRYPYKEGNYEYVEEVLKELLTIKKSGPKHPSKKPGLQIHPSDTISTPKTSASTSASHPSVGVSQSPLIAVNVKLWWFSDFVSWCCCKKSK